MEDAIHGLGDVIQISDHFILAAHIVLSLPPSVIHQSQLHGIVWKKRDSYALRLRRLLKLV